jgi:transcriptional regulator with XRE-family HTH domain
MGRKVLDNTGQEWALAIGNVIRRERIKRGITQEALADLTDSKDRNEVNHLEMRGSVIEVRTLEFYAAALQIDIRDLFRLWADEKDRQANRRKRGQKMLTDAMLKK